MRHALTCYLFLSTLCANPVFASPTSLGIVAPRGESTVAFDMNTRGQVAAVLEDNDGYQRAVFFEKGRLTELGTLGGKGSDAKHINDKGQIIGSASKQDGTWRAYVYDGKSGMRELGTLKGPSSHGTALNNDGAAVGFSDLANGEWHAFLYTPGEQLKDLGTLGGKISYASGINNHGQVVGTAALPDEYKHAFLYEPEHGMVDLGTLGGRASTATAINDKGVVVGASEMPNRRWHAFVFDGKTMMDIGALIGRGDSYATGINEAGHVVGNVLIGGERMSFVWRDNKMLVHRAGYGLYMTNAINNAEQVIGATFFKRMDAAIMHSASIPYMPHGGLDLMQRIALVLIFAGAGVMIRKRYKGLAISSSGSFWLK